jgi:hypothetical protein
MIEFLRVIFPIRQVGQARDLGRDAPPRQQVFLSPHHQGQLGRVS